MIRKTAAAAAIALAAIANAHALDGVSFEVGDGNEDTDLWRAGLQWNWQRRWFAERSWTLGKEACDNPFATDESRNENFLAYTDAMLNLAQLHLRRGELDRARAILDELLALSPEREDARALDAQLDSALQKEASK